MLDSGTGWACINLPLSLFCCIWRPSAQQSRQCKLQTYVAISLNPFRGEKKESLEDDDLVGILRQWKRKLKLEKGENRLVETK